MRPIEETYLKLHCKTCGKETPHVDNSTTVQCCVCYQSNYEMSYENRFYNGWELAAFWHSEYYNAKSNIVGHVVSVGFENNWAAIPSANVVACDANQNAIPAATVALTNNDLAFLNSPSYNQQKTSYVNRR